jgi:AraC family ethanolamine operon transcriptional activator
LKRSIRPDTDLTRATEPAAGPAVRRLALDSFRPQTLDDAVSGGAVEHVQLASGRFVGELLHAEIGDRRIDYGAYNLPLLAHGGMPLDHIVLGFVASDVEEGRLNGELVGDGAVVVLVEASELHYRLAPRTRWLGFHVTRSTLDQTGASLGARSFTLSQLAATGRQQLMRTVTESVETLRAIERGDPDILDATAACAIAAETLTAVFSVTLASEERPGHARAMAPARRLRIVRRTREYFDAHLAHPIEITRVCAHAGASVRTIERAFLDTCGANPKQMLTLMRMSRARRALQAARRGEVTVARVAVDCGFFHLGRFSTNYAALYGESPSATLRN